MTDSEAIIKHIEENNNRIENIKFFMSSNHDANIDDCKRNIEILTISNKALEKQIPKKTILQRSYEKSLYKCPCCDSIFVEAYENMQRGYIPKFCEMCGQSISFRLE